MLETHIKDILQKRKDAKLIIFTDLDATLLDHYTYSFTNAKEALELADKKRIDIIFATSKTRAEIEIYRKKTGNKNPFIVENGGAIFIPEGFFDEESFGEKLNLNDQYRVKIFGFTYKELIEGLESIKTNSNLKIRGISEMTPEEISNITCLSLHESKLAKAREYSEPFIVEGDISADEEAGLFDLIKSNGFNLIRGGRFYHLVGNSDKGKAVRYLKEIYSRFLKCDVISVGIGDSKNDIPLLKYCDIPVAVQRPEGKYNPFLLEETDPYLAEGIGPEGWNNSIVKIIGLID